MIMREFKNMPRYEETPTKTQWTLGFLGGAAFLVFLGFVATWGG